MYTVSPNNSTTSLSDEDVDDVDVQDMKVSFHYPKDVHPEQWSSSLTRGGSVEQSSPSSPVRFSVNLAALLPPEILIHVLRQLHSTRDLYHALRVSRTWCSCAVELLWHRPSFQALPHYHRMLDVITSRTPTTFEYATFIRRLNFAFIASEITDALFTPLSICTKLERLTLVGCTELSDDALLQVLPHMRNMVALDLSNIPHLSDGPVVAIAKAAPKLQGINLSGCKNITDDAVSAIAENCPFIRRVKLFNVKLVTDESIMALAQGCPVLLEIDLNGCPKITDFSTRELWSHCPQLRELRLSQCIELSDLGFPATPPSVPDTPNTLVLAQPNGRLIEVQPFPVTQAAVNVDIMAPLRLNRIAEHLRILDLTACALLTDDAIAGIVSTAPKLRNLVLAKCPQLTDAGVEHICKLGKHLHYLHLGHAASITDRSVRTLARSCTRLRYIDLACCPLLTDMSVFELSVLPKLRRIGLVRVTNLTDQAIFSLADRHSTLERIHLSYCEHISVLAVHFLLQRLVKLTHLSLTGVPAFRRPELQKFCRSPPGEFNTTQRAAFCVYSGKGVNDLRKYLADLLAHVHATEADNDTDYDMEDDESNGMTAAEMYVEQQRERERTRGRGRRGVERGRFRYEEHGGTSTAFPARQTALEAQAVARPLTVGSVGTVIAPEEIFEEEARTPLSRFSTSLLASLPLNGNVTIRRAPAPVNEPPRQPEAGPSSGAFVEETKASSLATTPSPTELHPSNRVGNGAIPSEDSPPRNFADSPIVESSAPTPAIDSTQRFHTAFFQYPSYGSGFGHENTRRNGDNGRLNGTFSSSGPSTSTAPAGPLRTFTPPQPSPGPMNGRQNVYTPDFVLSTLGNRRPPMGRSLSDTGYGDGSSTPGGNNRATNGHWQNDDLEMGGSSDSVPLLYPYRYYHQQPPEDSPTAWPPQALVEAHGQRERLRQKDSSRSKRRQHGANSPIPYLSSSPTTKELQESVHSAFAANGSGTSYGGGLTAGEEPSSVGFGGSRLPSGAVAPEEVSSAPMAVSAESSRGRSSRRSWKNTFTAAENYASALFFGRGTATGSGNVSSASSSSGREGGRAS